MTHPIMDWEQDAAGKWRVRVAVGDDVVMFKFPIQVEDTVVQIEVERYIASRDAALAEAAAQQAAAAQFEAMLAEQGRATSDPD